MLAAGALVIGGLGLLVAVSLVGRTARRQQQRTPIVRLGVSEQLPFAHATIHGDTAYLAGVTAQADGKPLSEEDSVEVQTSRVLAVIENRLALAGTDKSRLLQAQVWLKDIHRDFNGMNSVWSDWVGSNKPVRATVEAKLAKPTMLVEIQVVAAL